MGAYHDFVMGLRGTHEGFIKQSYDAGAAVHFRSGCCVGAVREPPLIFANGIPLQDSPAPHVYLHRRRDESRLYGVVHI